MGALLLLLLPSPDPVPPPPLLLLPGPQPVTAAARAGAVSRQHCWSTSGSREDQKPACSALYCLHQGTKARKQWLCYSGVWIGLNTTPVRIQSLTGLLRSVS
jgi:hypothetical protein